MITFACPSCGAKLKVKPELAGKRGSCPSCKKPVLVPAKRKTDIPDMAAMITSLGELPAPAAPGARRADSGKYPALGAGPGSGTNLGPGAGPASAKNLAQATAPPTQDTPSAAAEAGPIKLDFLGPPQKPGEIGRLGPYRIFKLLGTGGMGMVLQAEDPALRRPVAIKVMRSELASNDTHRQRFVREAQATAAVEHNNIVHIYQVGQDRGLPYIAMPLLRGETLDQRVKRDGKLPVETAVRIARQIAEGLAAAHKTGLIHRDIKPANIWLEAETGTVKILDFGLARPVDGDDIHLTKSGAILGTPAFMAPEQAASQPVDFRCDLFSLGGVLYRMLTDELPFKGADAMAVLLALGTQTPPRVTKLNPAVPPELADLVAQLLAKKPQQRPASARAAADALAAIEADHTQVLLRPPAPEPPARALVRKGVRLVLRSLLWTLGGLFRLAVWICRIPGRKGLVIKSAIGLVFLVLLAWIFWPTKEPRAQVITNSIGMELVALAPGEFRMGAPETDGRREGNETPQHLVRISRPFYLGVYEVTQQQYEKIMGANPSASKGSVHQPVENVSRDEATEFCWRLSCRPAEREARRVYRLPTEAEWEYACRAGKPTVYSFGDNPSLLGKHAWFTSNAAGKPRPVGGLPPNRWGLCDMHGNVAEWCLDGPRPYAAESEQDPRGVAPDFRNRPLRRGGSFYDGESLLRASARREEGPPFRRPYIGFRAVCEVLPPPVVNSIGMHLIEVPAGRFWMGSPATEPGHAAPEGPEHLVVLTRPFHMGIHEVTVGQFKKFVQATGYPTEAEKTGAGADRLVPPKGLVPAANQMDPACTWRNPGFRQDDNHPVVAVSHNDAIEFCKWLSKQEGKTYRLPTEAQWEYACRAGTQTRLYCGDDGSKLNEVANTAEAAFYKVFPPANPAVPFKWDDGYAFTAPVGRFRPNAFGLYDMYGNVYELVADWFDANYYARSGRDDPTGPETATGQRVFRGGGWDLGGVPIQRSAGRGAGAPAARWDRIGFRVVLVGSAPVGDGR